MNEKKNMLSKLFDMLQRADEREVRFVYVLLVAMMAGRETQA